MALGPALPETLLVLDTNILTAWRYRKPGIVTAIAEYQARLKFLPALTAITVHEALYGFENKAAKSGTLDQLTARDRIAIEQLINSCVVVPFDQRAAEIAAYIIPRLPKNIPKQTLLDGLIAATALAHGYGVATNDQGFEVIGQHTPTDLIFRIAFWSR
jgi:predicted nucleic acid-binding protein